MNKAKILILSLFSFCVCAGVASAQSAEAPRLIISTDGNPKVQGIAIVKVKLQPYSTPAPAIALYRLSADTMAKVTDCTVYTSVYLCKFNTALLKNGDYSFQASTNIGDSVIKSGIFKLNINNPAPSLAINNLRNKQKVKGVITVSVKQANAAFNSVKLINVQTPTETLSNCKIGKSNYWTCSFNTAVLKNGTYQLQAVSPDNIVSQAVSLEINNPVPKLTITKPGNKAKAKGLLTFYVKPDYAAVKSLKIYKTSASGAIEKEISECKWYNDNYWKCDFDTKKIANGDYYFQAKASIVSPGVTLAAGTVRDISSQILNMKIENPVPELYIYSHRDRSQLKGLVTFKIRQSNENFMYVELMRVKELGDARMVGCTKLDKRDEWLCAFDTKMLSNASYKIYARGTYANQVSGKTDYFNSKLINITIENPAPALTISYPANNAKISKSISVKVLGVNATFSSVDLRREGTGSIIKITDCAKKSNNYWECLLDTTKLNNGKYVIFAVGNDISSNKITVTVDNLGRTANTNHGDRCTANDICAGDTTCKPSGRYPVVPGTTHSESYCCLPMECASVIPETVYQNNSPLPPFHCVSEGGTDTLMDGRKATCDNGILYPMEQQP